MTTMRSFVAVALVVFLAAGRVQAQDGDVICPLSENQQEESQNVWATIAEVFKHDRCSNCHGKKNPFTEDTEHPDRMKIELDEKGEISEKNTFDICEGCHSEAGGRWQTPPASMHWWNQSVEELCRTQHKLNKPVSLINHSRGDKLIVHSFTGLMGLNEVGRDLVEKTTPYPDPPPVDHGGFVQRLESWLQAQDIEPGFGTPWQGDEVDCGCVPSLYEIVIDAKYKLTGAAAGCTGEAHISETIPIDFTAANGESRYTGTGTGTYAVSNFACPTTGCTVDYRTATTDVQLEGDVVKANGAPSKLTMKTTRTVGATSFAITCPCEPGFDCPYPVTVQVPQLSAGTADIQPQLDARLGDYERGVAPAKLTITIRKRN
jgi:hypothetical protein